MFAVNRSQSEPLAVDVRALAPIAVAEHVIVCASDPEATNSAESRIG